MSAALRREVDRLRVGQKVRVSLRHRDRPVVGVLRGPNPGNEVMSESPLLFMEPGSNVIRDIAGGPGWSVRSVEVLNSRVTTREERLEEIDEAVDEYLTALEIWRYASKGDADALAPAVAETYRTVLALLPEPFDGAA